MDSPSPSPSPASPQAPSGQDLSGRDGLANTMLDILQQTTKSKVHTDTWI
jgi:hypothetical protein